jgi:hypothetical protein
MRFRWESVLEFSNVAKEITLMTIHLALEKTVPILELQITQIMNYLGADCRPPQVWFDGCN